MVAMALAAGFAALGILPGAYDRTPYRHLANARHGGGARSAGSLWTARGNGLRRAYRRGNRQAALAACNNQGGQCDDDNGASKIGGAWAAAAHINDSVGEGSVAWRGDIGRMKNVISHQKRWRKSMAWHQKKSVE